MKLDLFNRKIESWLEDGYLCRDRIIQWLQGIVDKVLKTVNWPRNIKVRTVSLQYNNPLTFINFWSLCLLVYWEAFPRAEVLGAQSLLLIPCVSLRMYGAVTSLYFLYLHWLRFLTQGQHLLSDFLVILCQYLYL